MAAAALAVEESPGSTRQRCRVTPGGGNPRESATENRPPRAAREIGTAAGKGETVGQEPTAGRATGPARQAPPGAMPNRDRVRGQPRRAACAPADPGWQLDPVGNGGTRGMVIHGTATSPDKTRLTGHPRIFLASSRNPGFCGSSSQFTGHFPGFRVDSGRSVRKRRASQITTGARRPLAVAPEPGATLWRSRPRSRSA